MSTATRPIPRPAPAVPAPATRAAAQLGHPARRRIAAVLADAAGGLTAGEVAAATGMARAAALRYLRDLVRTGVVAAAPETGRRRAGRPRVLHRLADDRFAAIADHQEVVRSVLDYLPGGDAPEDDLAAFGRRQGAFLAGDGGAPAVVAAFADLGFAPEASADDAEGTLELRLGACPFASDGRAPSPAVCALHRGMAAGVAARAADGGAVTGFRPAGGAGCRITFAGLHGEGCA